MKIKRAALGRSARLGDLYNACTDSFCNGLSVFGSKLPESLIQVVHVDPNESVMCDIAYADSCSDRCDNLNLQSELKLSVCGLDVPLRGCAIYLAAKYGIGNESTVSVVYQHRIITEKLNLFSEEAKSLVSLDQLNGCEATHVVFEIERGAHAVLALNYGYKSDGDKTRISEELSKVLKGRAVKRILATENDEKLGNTQCDLNGVKFEFNADLVVPGQEDAGSLDDYVELFQKLSSILIEDTQKAKPVVYTLVPLHIVALVAKGRLDFERNLEGHDETTFKAIISFLDDLDKQMHTQSDILEERRKVLSLLDSGLLDEKDESWKSVLDKADELKQQIGNNIKNLRLGKVTTTQVQETLRTGKGLLQEMNQCFANQFKGDAKSNYIKKLKEQGVFVVNDIKEFEEKLSSGHYYVFFANLAAMDEVFSEMSQTFEQLCQKDSQKCILHDISTHPYGGVPSHLIIYYADGVCIEDDVVRILKLLQDYNVMKYTAKPKFGAKPPDDRAHAEMRCPKNCGGVKRKWICYYCQQTVNYGFSNCFYCGCGESDVRATRWWCQDPEHGATFGQFPEFFLRQELFEIPRCKECNVLLLGETGSGKSTWINSIANYVICNSLEMALQRPLTYLIPSSFYIQTSTCEGRTIQVGESEDEVFTIGQSATQKPKSYTFMYNNIRIRLIDVPGMCDTRGPVYDRQNFNLILQKLETITELHAICILLTPDTSKLTLSFQYCISELLTHLHKSAASNIVFCFTNTRRTLYRAGQTLPVLKKYLKKFEERRQVKIEMSKETMYFFDNEAFKLLCAVEDQVIFTDKEKDTYKESWEFSARETFRFLEYLIGLKPHRTREMVSLNEARRIIIALTRPLADITDNINLNIRLTKDSKRECEELDLSASELVSRLHIKQITLVAIPIDYPRTTCASARCSEIRTLPITNVKTVHYKRNCHEHCHLKGIELKKYPDERLKKCSSMSKDHTCLMCGCKWNVHLHVNFLQEQREITIVDKTTESLLKEKKHRKIEKEDVLAAYDRQIAALEKRRKMITEICANFGTFLECNSIVPYNDTLVQYLNWAIKMAKQSACEVEGEEEENYLKRAENLTKCLNEYTEEVEILKANICEEGKKITSDDVVRMKKELSSMSSNDCDIASYLKVLEAANERNVEREDRYFEADEYVVNKNRRKKLPEKSWTESFKWIPGVGYAIKSYGRMTEAKKGGKKFRRALPPTPVSCGPTQAHIPDSTPPSRTVVSVPKLSHHN